jgi:hypothetical protein
MATMIRIRIICFRMSEVDWNPVYSRGAWNNIAGPFGHRAVAQPLVGTCPSRR